jgi:hypothetical protein
MKSHVPNFSKQLKSKGCEEMVHKHSYVTPKFMPVNLSTGQKLVFPSPTISATSRKIQMFFSMDGHPQPLKNRRAIQLLTGLGVISGVGAEIGGITSSSLVYKNLSLEIINALDTLVY